MKKLLVIGYVWPEPTSSAAGKRMMQILTFFQERSFEIVFATSATRTGNEIDLERIDIKTRKIAPNDPAFDALLKELMPDIVLFDRYMMEEQFGWRVDEICPGAIKILDTEDLHFLRKARQIAWKKGISAKEIFKDFDLAKREIAAIYRCDLSLIISQAEMKLLTEEFAVSKKLLHYFPILFGSENLNENVPGFSERSGFMHIGNFLHEPNWNAVLYLKEKIWPEIRKKMPSAELKIYGSYPGQKVWDLNNPEEGFHIMGKAENADEVFKQSRLLLAPLQFGAGLKGKLLDAMQNGTPSITTPVGAEGISEYKNWPGAVCENDSDYIRCTLEFYENEESWCTAQTKGFEVLKKHFSRKAYFEKFDTTLQELQNNLKAHRDGNFTGKMMKFHLNKSTYYLSKFIEEKNKKN